MNTNELYNKARTCNTLFYEVPVAQPVVVGSDGIGHEQRFERLIVLNPSMFNEEQKDALMTLVSADLAEYTLANRAYSQAAYDHAMKPWWKRWLGL